MADDTASDDIASGDTDWRELLDEERRRLTTLAYELDDELTETHQQEAGGLRVAQETEMDQSLLAQVSSELDAVEAAIARLDAGTYGICETCGEAITPERLRAQPATGHCVRHEPV